MLKSYEDRNRYRARRALWDLPEEVLRPSLKKWLILLDSSNVNYAHHLTEALWLHQQRGWINVDLFEEVSRHPDYHSRAAAAHLLRHWSKDLPGAERYFLRLANDQHPKVRLETVVSSTWADPSIAVVVLEEVSEHPQDNYLKFAISNARKALGSALINHPMTIDVKELETLPISESVLKALIRRPELNSDLRLKALKYLSEESSKSKE